MYHKFLQVFTTPSTPDIVEGQIWSFDKRCISPDKRQKEKEYFMLLSMRKTFLIVMMALALLAGLSGLSAHMVSMPAMYDHTGIYSSHMPAGGGNWYCPPPPRGC